MKYACLRPSCYDSNNYGKYALRQHILYVMLDKSLAVECGLAEKEM